VVLEKEAMPAQPEKAGVFGADEGVTAITNRTRQKDSGFA
jgi:hypothetical protein